MTKQGKSFAAFAYAANNPLRYFDSAGLAIQVSWTINGRLLDPAPGTEPARASRVGLEQFPQVPSARDCVLPTQMARLNKSLLVDVAPVSISSNVSYILENYVWLDGAPVAMLRGGIARNGSGYYVRSSEAATTTCSKLGEPGYCGRFHIVTDFQKKPVVMMRAATSELTQVANWDAFGNVNRIPLVTGDNSNNPQTLAIASLPAGQNFVRLRANYVVAPNNPITVAGATAFGTSTVPQVNAVGPLQNLGTASTATVAIGGTVFTLPSGMLPGVQLSQLEYYRTSSGNPLFTPLRFPGQYYDAELELFENWNRYLSPDTGRYLSPEPMLQSPVYLRRMAQAGLSVPSYAYAANNPLRYIDPSGRVFISPTARQRNALNRLKMIPALQETMNYFDYSPDVQISITENPYEPTRIRGTLSRQCGGIVKARMNINVLDATFTTGAFVDGFEFVDLIAHELGHLEAEMLGDATPFESDQNADDWFIQSVQAPLHDGQYSRPWGIHASNSHR